MVVQGSGVRGWELEIRAGIEGNRWKHILGLNPAAHQCLHFSQTSLSREKCKMRNALARRQSNLAVPRKSFCPNRAFLQDKLQCPPIVKNQPKDLKDPRACHHIEVNRLSVPVTGEKQRERGSEREREIERER